MTTIKIEDKTLRVQTVGVTIPGPQGPEGPAGPPGPGAVKTYTTGNIHFPMDPAIGIEVPEGTIFTNQAEVDAFLLANTATHFKYVMDCWDALPDDIYHAIYFDLYAGIHRPRAVPRGEQTFACWVLGDYPGQPRHHEFHSEGPAFISLTSVDYIAPWVTTHAGPYPVISQSTVTEDRYFEVAPGTFTPGELRGLYCRNPNSFLPLPIRDNTDSRVQIAGSWSGAQPATISIQKQGIVFRNSYDDLTYAINKPMFMLREDGFRDFSQRVVFDSIRFEQYALSQNLVDSEGSIYHDVFLCTCDQARMRDEDSIDSRGTWFRCYDRGSQGQWWKCTYRGQKDSITPTNNSARPFEFNMGQLKWGGGSRCVLNDTVIRGNSNSVLCRGINLNLNQVEFDNFSNAFLEMENCSVESGQQAHFRNTTSRALYFTRDNYFNRACYFDNCGDSSSSSDSLFYVQGRNNVIDFSSIALKSGPTKSPSWAFYVVSAYNNTILLSSAFTDGLLSVAGDVWNADGQFSFSELDAPRRPAKQPDGVMANIIKVLQISDNITPISTKNLAFVTAGNLLSFDGGTGVDISGLGTFVLVGASGDWVVVAVAAAPVSNYTFPITVQRDWMEDYRGNRLHKVS